MRAKFPALSTGLAFGALVSNGMDPSPLYGIECQTGVVWIPVIYYWLRADWQIRLLMLYPKSRKDDLSAAEKAMLKKVVENWNG